MDPNNPRTKLTSAWTYAEKHYAKPDDKYRDNWDRIFKKKPDDVKMVDILDECGTPIGRTTDIIEVGEKQ